MSNSAGKDLNTNFMFQSDAVCIDPLIGQDLFAYLNGGLRGERLERFELHLLECSSCDNDVANCRTMTDSRALRMGSR